jgi:hypothetical protein
MRRTNCHGVVINTVGVCDPPPPHTHTHTHTRARHVVRKSVCSHPLFPFARTNFKVFELRKSFKNVIGITKSKYEAVDAQLKQLEALLEDGKAAAATAGAAHEQQPSPDVQLSSLGAVETMSPSSGVATAVGGDAAGNGAFSSFTWIVTAAFIVLFIAHFHLHHVSIVIVVIIIHYHVHCTLIIVTSSPATSPSASPSFNIITTVVRALRYGRWT